MSSDDITQAYTSIVSTVTVMWHKRIYDGEKVSLGTCILYALFNMSLRDDDQLTIGELLDMTRDIEDWMEENR